MNLGPSFWKKLSSISSSLGMDPKDLLTVMYYESGLNPQAHNKDGDASGLIQFMPDTLKGLGFQGSHGDFRSIDAETQLDYVEKYVRNQMKYNGGPFKSATQYYVANLWPVALRSPGVINQEASTPIIEKEPKFQKYKNVSIEQEKSAYKSNSGLDVDHDGIISYGDLDRVMNGVKSSSAFKFALNQLSGQSNQIQETPSVNEEYLSQVNTLLDQYLGALSSLLRKDHLNKKAELKKLSENQIKITLNSDKISSFEFSRILCLALDEEAAAEAWIDPSGEINCIINGPKQLCLDAVTELSNVLAEEFYQATKKIGGIKIVPQCKLSKVNKKRIDLDIIQSAYTKFHLKFI